ncbi:MULTISPECIES: hypothetical protein [Streptomyces]|uniref:hypothetical protein n=1 Tax=Streptomyces TaxID=1883 RepID=UPI0029A82036|nr:hypothetical protein [Streptomyces europaeiscabiei]MDX3781481.1 hypothetical protein [Streptomyces europaeiscabiei]
MAQPRRAATACGCPRRADTAGRLLPVLVALLGLLTLLGTAAPASSSGVTTSIPVVAQGSGGSIAPHADEGCATSWGVPARVFRDATAERHAPPTGGPPVPRCPVLPRPEPGALSASASEAAGLPEYTVRHSGRAPPSPAGS